MGNHADRKRARPFLLGFLLFLISPPGSHAAAANEVGDCHARQVRTLPGSGRFASDFLEAVAEDPDPKRHRAGILWGLTADLSSQVAANDRALYISRSADGGKTWSIVARLGPRYFNADIGEGERNGLAVAPGGADFVVTTQRGAFQVFARTHGAEAVVKAIAGPHVPRPDPEILLPKQEGDPVTANVVLITPNGQRMIVGYGYFDLHPQLVAYRRGRDASWVQDKPLPPLPTDMDLLSMRFEDRQTAFASLYLGTGDQAFRLKPRANSWTRVDGVGDDSAIQGISTVGGPHLAACWGVYNPISPDAVERVTHATFLLHRNEDEVGPDIRAFSVEVDPGRPSHEVVTSLTGAYASRDYGKTWKRLNDLPDGEFRTAHFNARDGTVIVSGIFGTFIVDPYSSKCSAQLRRRSEP